MFALTTSSANGSAAVVSTTYPGPALAAGLSPRPAAEPTGPRPVTKHRTPRTARQQPAESYADRQERIAKSKRSLLATPKSQRGADTSCVSGEFTTLSVVYDSLFESIYPTLPPALQGPARIQRNIAHRDMKRLHVSTLAVSENPMTLGADREDGSARYRGPISQLIVSNLLKIRDGRESEAIPLGNITVSQAVESAFVYLFVTVIAPVRVGVGFLPRLGSPLTDTGAPDVVVSSLSYNSILNLVTLGGQLGLQYLYQAISSSVVNQCVAQVTNEQREAAGRPSDSVRFDVPIAPIVADIADQLALADNETCTPISELSLSRIVARTADYAQRSVTGADQKRLIAAEARKILVGMRSTRIPHHLIPADPADFSQAEQIASLLGGFIPYVGGAPTDIILGLGHNFGQGNNPLETVSLADLTVTKSLTAAYYSWYLSVHLFSVVGGLVESPLAAALGLVLPTGVGTWSPTGLAGRVALLPLTYGLVNYHNVVRSMCLREDDTTGTGRGAEANRDRRTPR